MRKMHAALVSDQAMVGFVIDSFEGSQFTDDPTDRGGATRWGVTQRTLSKVLGRPVTAGEVAALKREEAITVLYQEYMLLPRITEIDERRLRFAVFDFAVHSGPATAIKALQRALGVDRVDGVIGPVTMAAVNHRANPFQVREQVIAARMRHLGALVTNAPSQAKYAKGWFARVATVLEVA